ncbi:MAG: type transport system permease protein [Thermoleophilaceae bacterium]|jgi:ABC-2 type transport system permease protein|nr:type transport system permease protein [Thermoleophilaceae bacterium]
MRWLLVKDLQILRRSPLLVAMLVLYPILIAALVGFAVTSGPSKPRVALLNEVPKEKTRIPLGGENVNVAEEAKPLFDALTIVRVKTEAEAIEKVRSGDVLAALILPADITQQLQEATSGTGTRPTVRVYYNAEDPAKQAFVENTIKARVQEANAALSKKVTQVALGYLKLIGSGGEFSFLGRSFNVLGLEKSETLLRGLQASLKDPVQRRALQPVIQFASIARQNLDLAGPLLESVGNPIRVDAKLVGGSATPLGAFAAAVAVAVTLMLVTVLLAAGSLALEREENAFRRLVRGLVTQTQLLIEKIGLAALCSVVVGLVLLIGLSLFVSLPWSRFPLWLIALVFGAAAFGSLGVAFGALTREVRAASLLAFMASLPIAVLGLVPSGAVSNLLYDVIRVISAVFPFRATLDALDSALGRSGSIGLPLLHLGLLVLGWLVIARVALRRFA